MTSLPVGQSDVLDAVYSTGTEVQGVVAEMDQYSQEAADPGWDPISTLLNKGLGFVIDHIAPVKEALELVTGSPDALNAAAGTYAQLSSDIDALGQQLHDELKTGFGKWQGEASEAAHQEMAHFLDGIHGTATLAGYMVQVLRASASMMQAAKDIIIGIIADFAEQMLVTWAIGAAGTILTFGLSDAAAMGATVAEAGVAVGRAGSAVSKVGKIIEKVGSVLKKIVELIRKIAGLLKKFGAGIQKVGGKLGETAAKVVDKAGPLGKLAGKGLGKAGEKVTEIGGNVGKVGSRMNEAGTTLGRMGDDLIAHDGTKFAEHAKEFGDQAGRVVDTAKNVHRPGARPAEQDEGFDWKGEVKDGAKEIYDKAKETVDSLPVPEQSAEEINEELTVSPGSYEHGRNRPVY
ncbi:hypothetical protein GCM10010174_08080 [Kutzneria viridogrisea]|uniref:WXG100 family type VII secretion target n=2 Tax=Kutzneria TaxID=43356 RepID=W5WK57_9PSEU|nr:WXG100 family type VII secretion target [Kutzneria albida]AHI01589.1 hypothetical protein KALB_8231 [Kutzneria albida DSM 43870]MBA8931553.1 uncharacterized protein YukE [Kutzneria viridogrisea]